MKTWKILGLAGLAGVAATGVAVARAERQRAQVTGDDVRAVLHARYEQATEQVDHNTVAEPTPSGGTQRDGVLHVLRRKLHRSGT